MYLGDLDSVVVDVPEVEVVLEDVAEHFFRLDYGEQKLRDALFEVHDLHVADVLVEEQNFEQVL